MGAHRPTQRLDEKRVNQCYGTIHPKNCFRAGQAMNCQLNAGIAAATSDVTLWLCQIDNHGDLDAVERASALG